MAPEDSREPRSTEVYRAQYREKHIPAWYRGELHVALTAACVLVPSAVSVSQLQDVRALELFIIPLMFVLGSLVVWTLHRYVLHRPLPGLRPVYAIHTLQHHRFYDYEHNQPEGARDYHITLFPIAFGPSLVVLSFLLGSWAASAISDNVGRLVTIMMLAYYGLYELVHLASHLPDASRVLRLPLLRRLREHHRLHHDPRLMGRYNFNIVLPLADWLFGSLLRERPLSWRPSPGAMPEPRNSGFRRQPPHPDWRR